MRLSWLLFPLLAGCASTTELPGPEGQATYLIECPGPAAAVEACLRKGHSLCPSGYAVLDARPALDSAAGSYPGVGFAERWIVVQCFRGDRGASDANDAATVRLVEKRVDANLRRRERSVERVALGSRWVG